MRQRGRNLKMKGWHRDMLERDGAKKRDKQKEMLHLFQLSAFLPSSRLPTIADTRDYAHRHQEGKRGSQQRE